MAQVIFQNIYKTFPRRKEDVNSFANSDQQSQSDNSSVKVLSNINLTIKDREFMVLVGQSGCGKSTLLRLLAGLETLTEGELFIDDLAVKELPPKSRDIAMVFQNYALYPHLDIYNNIAFGLRRAKNSTRYSSWLAKLLVSVTSFLPQKLRYVSPLEKDINKQVKSVAKLLQIEPLLNRLPKELSGGQKQRVALGRAIVRKPQVFLMDEPLSNLDAKLRTETRGQIVQLQKQLGTTTIYVTHDQTEAMTMGDRIAVMDQGRIQQVAKPLEVYNHPANLFVAGFIGSPPMNFLTVELDVNDNLKQENFTLSLPHEHLDRMKQTSAKKFVLGIRPQHFLITDEERGDLGLIVNSLEALGNETIIYGCLFDQETKLTIRTNNQELTLKPQDYLHLKIDSSKINIFDATTGKSIS